MIYPLKTEEESMICGVCDDENSVNLLGNSFLNEFIGSHKVFGIKKLLQKATSVGGVRLNAPQKDASTETRIIRVWKYKKNKNLTDKRLWKHLMEKLGKTARKLSKEKQQSTYILLDVPFGVGIEKLFFAEFKQLVFDVVERRIRQHYTRTKWNMDSYIPLDLKRNDSEIIEG
uniref:Macro domain-containing protein n=1 Tax=Rhabditophanes sp. KR3021 TaxID=114890 RepID=A0AC35UBD5_9BILA